MAYGHFDDEAREYVITDPITPRPWINYLGNRRLSAFISHNAGGLLWHLEPQSRRITRYHYIPAPGDRPGFYVYVRDLSTGEVWNPHFAPACVPLDSFECRHGPGVTRFIAQKNGTRAELTYAIAPDDMLIIKVSLWNTGRLPANLQAVSYVEFGLLEFMREIVGWCYLKHHVGFRFDPAIRAIRYDYHAFEAPFTPRIVFGCTADPAGWECSRDAFIGPVGSLERPQALQPGAGLTNSDLPLGGHGCGTIAVNVALQSGESREFAYLLAIADTWPAADALLAEYSQPAAVDSAIAAVRSTWRQRLDVLRAETGDACVDRFVNTWNPLNALVALEHARIISTDHMGLDGLRYRDTTQDALAAATTDPAFATDRMRLIFAQQTRDGGGCFSFYPHNPLPTSDRPHRSDNTVWQIYTIHNLLAETGDFSLLDEIIPFRDGGEATVYDHVLLGLKHVYDRRGPHGLPTLFDADWNDGLALFNDPAAESVLTGMQLVHSCRLFSQLAARLGRNADARWCHAADDELAAMLNSDAVWDGRWYRRLLLSNGKHLGGSACRQGSIYVNPQSWAVISGVADGDRARTAMQSALERLDTHLGLRLLDPPFTGIPEPEDPPLGSSPGTAENGAIFCHANTWAIIAECLLGNGDRAFKYYRQMLPEVAARTAGQSHYEREPFVYVSTIVGPASKEFGKGGISWLTGTASWMYVAATQYILGIRPTYDGLAVRPCLPSHLGRVMVRRRFRGCVYDIEIENEGRRDAVLSVNGRELDGCVLPPQPGGQCRVRCRC